jgi:chitinase
MSRAEPKEACSMRRFVVLFGASIALVTACTTGAIDGVATTRDDNNGSPGEPFEPAAAPLPVEGSASAEAPPPKGAPKEPPSAERSGLLVAYWATWTADVMPVSSIPWNKITHVAHSFVLPSSLGGLRSVSTYVDANLVSAAHAHGVKVLASVGGWGANFDANVDPATRSKTVSAMASLCKTHGYDGIDIDWEYPTAATAAAWASMVSELRAALDAINPSLTISAAVSAAPVTLSVLPTSALEKLNWVGVMTYDYAGPWSSSIGHGAPLRASTGGDSGNVTDSIAYLTDTRGITRSKVLVGLPFYGYDFAGTALGATPVTPSNNLDYRVLVGRIGTAGWEKHVDELASVPYLSRAASPGFTSYDDETSIAAKCSFAKSKSLGGAIVWHLAGDRLPNGTSPLLDAAQSCR